MTYNTRSRARALLSSIPEQNVATTPVENAPLGAHREQTPSIVQTKIVPHTPNTTNQSMLNVLAEGRAPKKPAAGRVLHRSGEDERIGAHHGIPLWKQRGSESWLAETRMRVGGGESLVPDQRHVPMEIPEARERLLVIQGLLELQEDKRRAEERARFVEAATVHRLGPGKTWVVEDGVLTTRKLPQVHQRLGPEGTFLEQ